MLVSSSPQMTPSSGASSPSVLQMRTGKLREEKGTELGFKFTQS